MASNSSPLAFTDLFGRVQVEPSVTGIILTQTKETPRSALVNDLIVLGNFRSGVPGQLRRFSSISALRSAHDPDGNGDTATAIAAATRSPFGDDGVFGSADILTVRVGSATQASSTIKVGDVNLAVVSTADYGAHTNNIDRKIVAGTLSGSKKVTLRDKNNLRRTYTGDNLGPMMNVYYDGGGTCTYEIYGDKVEATVSTLIADFADKTIRVNGVLFTFKSSPVAATDVQVGASVAASLGSLATKIATNASLGMRATAAGTKLTIYGSNVTVEFPSSGGLAGTVATFDATFKTTVTGGGLGESLSLPLKLSSYSTFSQIAAFLNAQPYYRAELIRGANQFLVSKDADAGSGSLSATATVIKATSAAIVDWVNTKTQGAFTATLINSLDPDDDTAYQAFTGGSAATVSASDYTDALEVLASELDLGGIIIMDTDNEAVMADVAQFCADQQAAGRWFRAFFGSKSYEGQTENARATVFGQIASAIDNSRCRLVCQRMGVFGDDGSIEYLSPLFLAAAMAGGSAGNRPYVNPLTNKRLRYADIHPDDRFSVETRESLLQSGVTVVKRESGTRRVSLAVTCSQDPSKRMNRIMSERDTCDLIDSDVRLAFLPFRGRWSSLNVAATVASTLSAVLNRYVMEGAITPGVDESGNTVPAWEGVAIDSNGANWEIQAGVLRVKYRVYIPGELNHISLQGFAEYQRLAGSAGGSSVEISTTV